MNYASHQELDKAATPTGQEQGAGLWHHFCELVSYAVDYRS